MTVPFPAIHAAPESSRYRVPRPSRSFGAAFSGQGGEESGGDDVGFDRDEFGSDDEDGDGQGPVGDNEQGRAVAGDAAVVADRAETGELGVLGRARCWSDGCAVQVQGAK